MNAIIVDTYYTEFLFDFYRHNNLAGLSYAEQRQKLLDTCFGVGDYYSRHLAKSGIEAEELIANCVPLELAWAREHTFRANPLLGWIPPAWTRSPLLARLMTVAHAPLAVVIEQIRRKRPDVLYLQDLALIPPDLLRSLKSSVKLVVGQSGTFLPSDEVFGCYDLILTSLPHYVSRLTAKGISTEYFRLGFDPIVLERVGPQTKRYACSFVGGISAAHQKNLALLEHLARHAEIDFFGYGAETLPAGSPIRARHHGPAWALDMFRTLAQSSITLNRHADYAEGYANNMRLYEATGMGSMLLTDAKSNLGELFEIGKEVVAYESAEHAVELIQYYAGHPAERDAIARAGQLRTLRDHTYERRMEELSAILNRHLARVETR